MSYELRTLIAASLPPASAVKLIKVTVAPDDVLLQLTATAPTACCARCAVPSSAVHSRHQRHLTDLPWGARPVRIQLTVRKFVCRNPSCERRIFTERLPDLVAPSARKSTRLIMSLRAIGMAVGGQAGTRLAARLRLPASPATLLRLVRAAPVSHVPLLEVVGIDEWAWRRGHRYGTILVNLADHRAVDLLPDRSAASVAAWLAQRSWTGPRGAGLAVYPPTGTIGPCGVVHPRVPSHQAGAGRADLCRAALPGGGVRGTGQRADPSLSGHRAGAHPTGGIRAECGSPTVTKPLPQRMPAAGDTIAVFHGAA
jgi:hypothetical protein